MGCHISPRAAWKTKAFWHLNSFRGDVYGEIWGTLGSETSSLKRSDNAGGIGPRVGWT